MDKSISGPNRSSEYGREQNHPKDLVRSVRSNEPPIVDPKEFLPKPFQKLEVGRLATMPDIELLRWLPTLGDETGLVLQEPIWYVIKASHIGVPSWIMPSNSDVLLHSHPSDAKDKKGERSIPSLGDFLNASPTAKNLIVSSFGITQHWYVEYYAGRRAIEAEMSAFFPRFLKRDSMPEYIRFLKDIGARYEIHPWNRVDAQKLRDMLRPPDSALSQSPASTQQTSGGLGPRGATYGAYLRFGELG